MEITELSFLTAQHFNPRPRLTLTEYWTRNLRKVFITVVYCVGTIGKVWSSIDKFSQLRATWYIHSRVNNFEHLTPDSFWLFQSRKKPRHGDETLQQSRRYFLRINQNAYKGKLRVKNVSVQIKSSVKFKYLL